MVIYNTLGISDNRFRIGTISLYFGTDLEHWANVFRYANYSNPNSGINNYIYFTNSLL